VNDLSAIRAGLSKDFLLFVHDANPGLAQRVTGMLSTELSVLSQHPRTGWFPLSHHMAINHALVSVAGMEGYRQTWRIAMRRMFGQPLLKAFVDGAVRVFGASPATLARVAPTAFQTLFRAAGRIECTLEPGRSLKLELIDFPVEHSQNGVFAEGMVGVFGSFVDLCKANGEVKLEHHDPSLGAATYTMTWEPMSLASTPAVNRPS